MKLIVLKLLVASGLMSLLCTTKVSEWVLLNTVPARYTLVYYHNTPPNETVKKQNELAFKSMEKANIDFKSIEKKDAGQPYFALFYGNRQFSTYDNTVKMKNLSSSPLREKIASEIMSGKLCVMLYLKTDNKEKDEKGLLEVKKTISASPFGDIISLIELNKNNIEEAQFVSLLLNVESDLKTIPEPMLFGIFGRFKALEPLVGRGISEENVNLMIGFLTADCSCLIKDDMPGTDILFTNIWENPGPGLVNAILDANPLLIHN